MIDRNHVTTGILIALLILTGTCAHAVEPTLYVSPSGNDTWSGRLTTANADKTDGPLATLNGARLAVRKLRAADSTAYSIVVRIAEGRYELTEPVTFESDDSGIQNAPTVYMAVTGARPVFSGGRLITGFTSRKDGLWEAHVPGVAEGKWNFEQLWVNGHRTTRARTPNTGYLRMESQVGVGYNPVTGKTEDLSKWAFVASAKDFARLSHLNPQELSDVQITTYSAWETAAHKVSALDASQSTIKLGMDAVWPFSMGNVGLPRYHLENYRAALDAPGEWFLGRDGILLYKPLPGEKLRNAVVYAPVATDFIVFAGDVAAGKTVENIQFRGLTFEHSQYLLPLTGRKSIQGEYDTDAVITAVNARNIWFDGCNIFHTGKYVFWFRYGSRDCSVTRCLMEDLGAGGVKIGEFRYYDEDKWLTKRIIVDNNIIRAGGKIQTAGIGVLIGDSPENQVTHNDISDLFYTAVSAGWNWAYTATNAGNNKIDFNHLHHIGYGVLSDMGGVYTLGLSEGTTVNNNVVHDVFGHQYGGWGLYNDAATTHMTLANNLVYHCGSGGYHQNFGKENHVTNNIIAYCGDAQVIRSTQEEHTSFTFDRNIVLFDTTPLGSEWSNNKYVIDNNLYFNSAGKEFTFAGNTLAEWRARGHDVNSIIADPMFRNPKKLDFRLKSGSPASKIGFIPFDYTQAGVYGDESWKALAKNYTYPKPERVIIPPPAKTFSVDFESVALGAYPMNFGYVYSEGKGESITVTDEAAATGKHSLKFVDVPGLIYTYNPHVDMRPRREDNSIVSCEFDVRVETGSIFWHEWRDWTPSTYIQGPSIKIAQGKLMVDSQSLMEIPVGIWTHIKVSCGLGSKAAGKFELAVTISGQHGKTFKDLKCISSKFKMLNYMNFVADANQDAVFYLDNVKLK